MNAYNFSFLANLLIVHMIATMSPGPNFMLIFQQSLKGLSGRSLGGLVLGVGLGSMVHSSLALLGVNVMLKDFPLGFEVLRVIGGGFLAYLGYRSLAGFLRSRRQLATSPVETVDGDTKISLSSKGAFYARMGFFSSVLNTKSLLYFSSVLPQFMSNDMSRLQLLSTPPLLCLITCLWFGAIGVTVKMARHQPLLLRSKDYLALAVGIMFVFLAGNQFLAVGRELFKA